MDNSKGWSDIDQPQNSKAQQESREKASNLAKCYHRLFSSEEGQKVLADLTTRFIMNNDTPITSQNVNYEAAYHNGEAGVVKYIIHQQQKAEVL